MSAYVDVTELSRLAKDLSESAVRLDSEMGLVLDRVAAGVMSDAVSNASSFGGTGELAAAVKMSKSGNKSSSSRRVGAAVRQAFFLEFGSPKTGAPRPWLTAPAAKGHHLLGVEMEKRAKPL